MPISSPYCMNYRVAVGPLVGQGCERSELPCLADGIIKLGRRPWPFYVYHICYLVDRRIRGQMLLMRNIVFGHSLPISRLFERKKTKNLRPSFVHLQLRQGRSQLLPTLPYQRTNRYAVVGIMSGSYPELA